MRFCSDVFRLDMMRQLLNSCELILYCDINDTPLSENTHKKFQELQLKHGIAARYLNIDIFDSNVMILQKGRGNNFAAEFLRHYFDRLEQPDNLNLDEFLEIRNLRHVPAITNILGLLWASEKREDQAYPDIVGMYGKKYKDVRFPFAEVCADVLLELPPASKKIVWDGEKDEKDFVRDKKIVFNNGAGNMEDHLSRLLRDMGCEGVGLSRMQEVREARFEPVYREDEDRDIWVSYQEIEEPRALSRMPPVRKTRYQPVYHRDGSVSMQASFDQPRMFLHEVEPRDVDLQIPELDEIEKVD